MSTIVPPRVLPPVQDRGPMPMPEGFHHMRIGEGVRSAAARQPDKTALIFEGASLTYRELVGRMNRLASVSHERFGLQVGDRAALFAPNCLEYLEILLGLADIGVAVATINSRLTARELSHIINDCKPRVIFAHPTLAEAARQAAPEGTPLIVLGDHYEALLDAGEDIDNRASFPEWQTFAIPYTSGTTGLPKGVLLPHRSRALTCLGMAAEFGCYGADEHFYAVAPMALGAGMVFAMGNLYFGGACTIVDKFTPAEMLKALNSGEITGVFVVPTMLQRMLELEPEVVGKYTGALKTIICNAAPLSERIKLMTLDYFGEGLLHECYGSTEAGIVTNLRPKFQRAKLNCVGTAFAMTEVELRDDNGKRVPPGEVGELFSRSPYLFNGYHDRPEETASVLDDNGWATVGDMAVQDEDGFFYIVDRKKDMVISGGVNIYPREVENVILTLDGVSDAAVIGVPDDAWGEALVACVVLEDGSTLTAESLVEACREHMASFKLPRHVQFLDILPRNSNGKVLKRELKANWLKK